MKKAAFIVIYLSLLGCASPQIVTSYKKEALSHQEEVITKIPNKPSLKGQVKRYKERSYTPVFQKLSQKDSIFSQWSEIPYFEIEYLFDSKGNIVKEYQQVKGQTDSLYYISERKYLYNEKGKLIVDPEAKLEEELKTLTTELDSIKKQLLEDTKEFERIQRQYRLENFKWAVLADNNTIDPIEFDLEKYLKDEEEKKKKSEIRPEQPITPETPDKPELPGQPIIPGTPDKPELPSQPIIPGAPAKPETPNTPVKPEDKAPGSSNNQPALQRPSVNSNGLKTLPNTGESQSGMATVAGLVALAVAARLKRKDKQN